MNLTNPYFFPLNSLPIRPTPQRNTMGIAASIKTGEKSFNMAPSIGVSRTSFSSFGVSSLLPEKNNDEIPENNNFPEWRWIKRKSSFSFSSCKRQLSRTRFCSARNISSGVGGFFVLFFIFTHHRGYNLVCHPRANLLPEQQNQPEQQQVHPHYQQKPQCHAVQYLAEEKTKGEKQEKNSEKGEQYQNNTVREDRHSLGYPLVRVQFH